MDDEPTFTLEVPLSGLPDSLRESAHREAVAVAAREALWLLEQGHPGQAERTLRIALDGGHPKPR